MAGDSESVALSWHVGEDIPLQMSFNPTVNITGWTIAFTARAQYGELPVLIEYVGLPQIVITDPIHGVIVVTIPSLATASAPLGDYFYAIDRVDPGFRRNLVEGVLTLLPAVLPAPV